LIRAIDFLVSRGHAENDIVTRYSLRKITALCKAGRENMKQENKTFGIAMRYGMNADARQFNHWLKE